MTYWAKYNQDRSYANHNRQFSLNLTQVDLEYIAVLLQYWPTMQHFHWLQTAFRTQSANRPHHPKFHQPQWPNWQSIFLRILRLWVRAPPGTMFFSHVRLMLLERKYPTLVLLRGQLLYCTALEKTYQICLYNIPCILVSWDHAWYYDDDQYVNINGEQQNNKHIFLQ